MEKGEFSLCPFHIELLFQDGGFRFNFGPFFIMEIQRLITEHKNFILLTFP